jgi:hypothetical protein
MLSCRLKAVLEHSPRGMNAPVPEKGQEMPDILLIRQGDVAFASLNPGAVCNAVTDLASDSEDFQEGRRAFAEKRSPLFRGR